MGLLLPGGKEFDYTGNIVPAHLRHYLVRSTQRLYRRFDGGELLSQTIHSKDYSVFVQWFFIARECRLMLVLPENILVMNYMIRGNISFELSGLGAVQLAQGRYGLFYIPGKLSHQVLLKPGIYHCIQISIRQALFRVVAGHHPLVQQFLHFADRGFSEGKALGQSALSPYTKEVIAEMLNGDPGAGARDLFIESQIGRLLRLYVHDQATRSRQTEVTAHQRRTLERLEELIMTNMNQDMSVNAIARKLGKGRSWLQRICKNYYGMGIHELVNERRMVAAADLLLTTDLQISEIVDRVSPLNFSAFSAAFSKYFKQSPSSYRKHGGQYQ